MNNSILLNLSNNINKQKTIKINQVKPKLHKLCEMTVLQNIVYDYFIRRDVITWVARNGAPPL